MPTIVDATYSREEIEEMLARETDEVSWGPPHITKVKAGNAEITRRTEVGRGTIAALIGRQDALAKDKLVTVVAMNSKRVKVKFVAVEESEEGEDGDNTAQAPNAH